MTFQIWLKKIKTRNFKDYFLKISDQQTWIFKIIFRRTFRIIRNHFVKNLKGLSSHEMWIFIMLLFLFIIIFKLIYYFYLINITFVRLILMHLGDFLNINSMQPWHNNYNIILQHVSHTYLHIFVHIYSWGFPNIFKAEKIPENSIIKLKKTTVVRKKYLNNNCFLLLLHLYFLTALANSRTVCEFKFSFLLAIDHFSN